MSIITSPPTPEELLTAISRCDFELAQIAAAPEDSCTPAFLPALGELDWQGERLLILRELADLATTAGKEDL